MCGTKIQSALMKTSSSLFLIFTSNNHTRIPCKRAGIHACMAEDLFGEWHSPRQVGLLVRESTDLAKLANPRMMIIIFTTVLNGPEARGGEGAKHADLKRARSAIRATCKSSRSASQSCTSSHSAAPSRGCLCPCPIAASLSAASSQVCVHGSELFLYQICLRDFLVYEVLIQLLYLQRKQGGNEESNEDLMP